MNRIGMSVDDFFDSLNIVSSEEEKETRRFFRAIPWNRIHQKWNRCVRALMLSNL